MDDDRHDIAAVNHAARNAHDRKRENLSVAAQPACVTQHIVGNLKVGARAIVSLADKNDAGPAVVRQVVGKCADCLPYLLPFVRVCGFALDTVRFLVAEQGLDLRLVKQILLPADAQ